MRFSPKLIKIHGDTVIGLTIYDNRSLPDIDAMEMFDSFMQRSDFRDAAKEFYDAFHGHCCDIFMDELKRLIDIRHDERKIELDILRAHPDNAEALAAIREHWKKKDVV